MLGALHALSLLLTTPEGSESTRLFGKACDTRHNEDVIWERLACWEGRLPQEST